MRRPPLSGACRASTRCRRSRRCTTSAGTRRLSTASVSGSPSATSSSASRSSSSSAPSRSATRSRSRTPGRSGPSQRPQPQPASTSAPDDSPPATSSRRNRALPRVTSNNRRAVTPSTVPPNAAPSSAATSVPGQGLDLDPHRQLVLPQRHHRVGGRLATADRDDDTGRARRREQVHQRRRGVVEQVGVVDPDHGRAPAPSVARGPEDGVEGEARAGPGSRPPAALGGHEVGERRRATRSRPSRVAATHCACAPARTRPRRRPPGRGASCPLRTRRPARPRRDAAPHRARAPPRRPAPPGARPRGRPRSRRGPRARSPPGPSTVDTRPSSGGHSTDLRTTQRVFPIWRVRSNPCRSNIATVPLCRKEAETDRASTSSG